MAVDTTSFAPTREAPTPAGNFGAPVERYDARDKVTGRAKYAADVGVRTPAYAWLVTSDIALGTIEKFDLTAAKAVPGVIDVLTHENMSGKIKKTGLFSSGGYASSSQRPLNSASIEHDGQIIAVVLANTLENAREAATLIRVSTNAGAPSAGFDAPDTTTWRAALALPLMHTDPSVGNIKKGLEASTVKINAEYETSPQHHNPMELFSTTCVWEGDRLKIYEPSQYVYGLKNGVAAQLGIGAEQIDVINPFVGGAFGSKGSMTQRTAIIAFAAKKIGRPVKLVVTRTQGFTTATYRAETRHKISLGATRDGRLQALSHEGWEISSRADSYVVAGTVATARMYRCPNVSTNVRIVYADRNTPGFMRAPAEVPYMFALESAIDELAVALAMDPIELRRVNDTQRDPIKDLPYSSRSLMPCFDAAAKAFGWQARSAAPQSMQDGDWLIGWGCATSTYPTNAAPAAARVRFTQDGKASVEIAAHDVGTGAYTVIAQTAAEKLGLASGAVTVKLGDSTLPPAPVAGGSITTASACSAVAKACDQIIARFGNATKMPDDVGAAFRRLGTPALEEYAEWYPEGQKPDPKALYAGHPKMAEGHALKDHIQFSFGAQFVEVRVHKRTKEIRVPRIVGAFAAGRILNPRTARSQLMGGMIWGISSALHEATEIDEQAARYVNTNLADYLIPVNADIGDVDVIFVSETDAKVNAVGAKGIGELGIVGTNAAVANAVFHATGQRCRNLPIRIESILT